MPRKSLIDEAKRLLGAENVFLEPEKLKKLAKDASVAEPVMPGLALRPLDREGLERAVRLCAAEGLPMTVRGAGTNLSGGAIPAAGGAVILTNGLTRILELNREDMLAVVEPGVITAHLQRAAAEAGLFYPPDPGSQAVSTLGGNVAENSGGLRGLKYGVTRDYVLALEFLDSEGDWIKAGARTVKCVTGYNLAGLMVGSEGTLGVAGVITLRLIPPPAASRALLAVFPDVVKAGRAVADIIAAPIVPATLEIMDNTTIRAVEDMTPVGLDREAGALLLVEVDGHPAQAAGEAARVEEICRAAGAAAIRPAAGEEEKKRVWEARRKALIALSRRAPTTVLEDATVPRSKVPDLIMAIGEIGRRFGLEIGTFGHAGDGNLHPTILCDRADADQWARAEEAVGEIFAKALELGGTLSGEHGIGLVKKPYLEKALGRKTLIWSGKMKRALDPKGLLNPGKVVGRLE